MRVDVRNSSWAAGGTCAVCGEVAGTLHQASEKMFGMGGVFMYLECRSCGCLQLIDPPADMRSFYPPYYYSYETPARPDDRVVGRLRRWACERRNKAQVFGERTPWGIIAKLRPRQDVKRLKAFIEPTGFTHPNTRILDVGSGAGQFLCELASAGFQSLLGVDPFLQGDIRLGRCARVLALPLDDVKGEFDIVMFNHSFEHMADQARVLRTVASLLTPEGVCVIAIPMASSDPWSVYGCDWVELDAPRHYFLHSKESMAILTNQAGFEIYHCQWSSDAFSYWGSEIYRRGLTLYDSGRQDMRQPDEFFSDAQIAEFSRRAGEANAECRGGRAIFYLRRCRRQSKSAF